MNPQEKLTRHILTNGPRDKWCSIDFYPESKRQSWAAQLQELDQMRDKTKETLQEWMTPISQCEVEEGFDFDYSDGYCYYTVNVPHAEALGFEFEYCSADQEIAVTINGIGMPWDTLTPEEHDYAVRIAARHDSRGIAFTGADSFALFVNCLVDYCGYNTPPGMINPYDAEEEDHVTWAHEDNPANDVDAVAANP